ncbi:MAG: isochorismatase family cysteine hydrolase [Microbacterium sp.]
MAESAVATPDDVNAFARTYYGMLGSGVYATPVPLDPVDTALLLIDIQECITKDAFLKTFEAVGMDPEPLMRVLDQIEEDVRATTANIAKILRMCRATGIRPIHVRIQSFLPDAADTGALHRSAGMFYPPGSKDSEILPEVAPAEGEIVLNKTCSGIHVGTQIDRVLRNLGISKVIVTGFYTDQCISTSVRDLSDLGYAVDLVEDAVGALSPERQAYALQSISKIYANAENTATLLERLSQLPSRVE